MPNLETRSVAAMVDALKAAEALADRAALFVAHAIFRLENLKTDTTDEKTSAAIDSLVSEYKQHADALANTLSSGEPEADTPAAGFDGTNGSDQENADYARGADAAKAGTSASTVASVDASNLAYMRGYNSISGATTSSGNDTPPADTSNPTGATTGTTLSGGDQSTETPPADAGSRDGGQTAAVDAGLNQPTADDNAKAAADNDAPAPADVPKDPVPQPGDQPQVQVDGPNPDVDTQTGLSVNNETGVATKPADNGGSDAAPIGTPLVNNPSTGS